MQGFPVGDPDSSATQTSKIRPLLGYQYSPNGLKTLWFGFGSVSMYERSSREYEKLLVRSRSSIFYDGSVQHRQSPPIVCWLSRRCGRMVIIADIYGTQIHYIMSGGRGILESECDREKAEKEKECMSAWSQNHDCEGRSFPTPLDDRTASLLRQIVILLVRSFCHARWEFARGGCCRLGNPNDGPSPNGQVRRRYPSETLIHDTAEMSREEMIEDSWDMIPLMEGYRVVAVAPYEPSRTHTWEAELLDSDHSGRTGSRRSTPSTGLRWVAPESNADRLLWRSPVMDGGDISSRNEVGDKGKEPMHEAVGTNALVPIYADSHAEIPAVVMHEQKRKRSDEGFMVEEEGKRPPRVEGEGFKVEEEEGRKRLSCIIDAVGLVAEEEGAKLP
nr:hypothetical protein Iba_chr04fCG2370 [Ipomoea batatas]